MEFSQYTDRLNEFTQKKDAEWNIFLGEFRKINPEPEMRPVEKRVVTKRLVSIGIKFWLALAAGIGALALSGFRVSERFFAVAGGYNPNINPFFSYGEAISAVLAVNVTIFALAIAYAYTTGKMSEGSQTWGLGTAILVSAVAGLGQAFKGLGPDWVGLVSVFDLVLAFVLGIGATALEYFSGDLLGVELVLYGSEKKAAESEYSEQNQQAEAEFTEQTEQIRREFTEQHRQWTRLAKQQYPSWMSQFARWNEQTERERTVRLETKQTEHSSRRSGTFTELVEKVLSQAKGTSGAILSFSELSEQLKVSLVQSGYSEQDATELVHKKKGQISDVRKRWINGVQ